jgi:hypothetical protein
MSRNIIDFDNFSSSDYEAGYSEEGLSIEEALDFVNGAELEELVIGLDEADSPTPADGVAGIASVIAGGSQGMAKAVQQGLEKAGVIGKDKKPMKLNPKEAFGKVTSGILNQVADPTKAALLLRNYYSRFLNMNKVPCNMINIDSKKEMKFTDYQKMMQDKAIKSKGAVKPGAPGAKPGAPAAGAAAAGAKPEGK